MVVRVTADWFRDAKFGIMIHWGLYSIPAWAPLDDAVVRVLSQGGHSPDGDPESDPLFRNCYAEWYQNSYLLTGSPTWHHHKEVYGDRPYEDFAGDFRAAVEGWDAAGWADLFAAAGARYVVPVTKHHDGFALWPSRTPNPYRDGWSTERDVVGELGAAVRAQGMRYGLYYSGGLDWTFGNVPIHRQIDVEFSIPNTPEYARYVNAHWRELIDRYEPSMLWNDIGYPAGGDPERLFAEYYARVPDGVVNDRFMSEHSDIRSPEYEIRPDIDPHVWETVRGLGLSFGWNRQETAAQLLSATELVHLLVDVVSKNGNLLLGVAPDDRGEIPAGQADVLREVGRWLAANGEAIYGTRPWTTAEATTADGLPVRFTRRGDTRYAIVLGAAEQLHGVPGIDPEDARRLGDGEGPATAFVL
ncbi:alpha-L-fucosidase [Phytohabitans rumicis]|uniref:alpha-L-fucosidase n=2 Tax=Phytohabitans rumicis TaxID=1076125 RepID=A0A6V8KXN8_9ACTN|nr:alpha-L-fucosidase [Phytohabitans rumicis]